MVFVYLCMTAKHKYRWKNITVYIWMYKARCKFLNSLIVASSLTHSLKVSFSDSIALIIDTKSTVQALFMKIQRVIEKLLNSFFRH